MICDNIFSNEKNKKKPSENMVNAQLNLWSKASIKKQGPNSSEEPFDDTDDQAAITFSVF
jgi:hypothetical protein